MKWKVHSRWFKEEPTKLRVAPRASREESPQLRPHPAQVTTSNLGAPSTAQAPRPSAPLQPPCSQARCPHPEQTSVLPRITDQEGKEEPTQALGPRPRSVWVPQTGIKTRPVPPSTWCEDTAGGTSTEGKSGREPGETSGLGGMWGGGTAPTHTEDGAASPAWPQGPLQTALHRGPCSDQFPPLLPGHIWEGSAPLSFSFHFIAGQHGRPRSQRVHSSPRSNDLTSAPDCMPCLHGPAGVPALRHYTCSIKQTRAAGLHEHFREFTSPFNSKLHGDNFQVPGPGRPHHGSSGSVSPIYQALPRPSPANPLCRQWPQSHLSPLWFLLLGSASQVLLF